MTAFTVGKDAGSALLNLAAPQGSKNAADSGGFQKVWDNQVNKDATGGNDAAGTRTTAAQKPQRGDSLKAKDVRVTNNEETRPKEMTPEEMEKAGELVNAAAWEMMQQVADAFGISMEELQAAMEDLGMETTDILEASQLGSLMLKLGGAQDSYALITDGELYGNYRMLMEKLEGTLRECAAELDLDPRRLMQMLEEGLGKEPDVENLTVEEFAPTEAADVPEAPKPETEDEPGELVLTGESGKASDAAGETVLQKEQETRNQDGSQSKGETKQEGDKSSHGDRQEVVFGHDFRTGQFQPALQQTQAVPQGGGWDADTREIMNQIMDYMKLRLNADSSNLEMQLHPASLGTLQIQIASKGGVVTANFITQNEAVKSALESQMVELRERFEEQGVKIEAIEVTVQTHEFERNLEQGRGRGQQEPDKKSRVRRIRPGGALFVGDTEEDEAPVPDLLEARNSTVVYSA